MHIQSWAECGAGGQKEHRGKAGAEVRNVIVVLWFLCTVILERVVGMAWKQQVRDLVKVSMHCHSGAGCGTGGCFCRGQLAPCAAGAEV
jgi:hypothetical protein